MDRQSFAGVFSSENTFKKNFFDVGEIKDIKAHFHYMFNNKKYLDFKRQWLQIRDKQLPFLGEFLDTADATNPGRERDLAVLDGEAWRANVTFAGGMASGLTPQSVEWFKFHFKDDFLNSVHEAKVVLDERLKVLTRVLNGSNFYQASRSNFLELAFGQAPLGIFEDAERGLYFEPYPIGSYAYDVDAFGRVSAFAVRKKMTAKEIVGKFKGTNIPEEILRAEKENRGYMSSFTVCWLVKENSKADLGKLGNMFLPYVSCYWIEGVSRDELMHVSGFHEMPVAVSRYQVIGAQSYGVGPAWFAQSDVRMLYKMLKDAFTNMELFILPPLQVADGVDVDYKPGGITYNSEPGRDKVETLFNLTPIFRDVFEAAERTRDNINRAYHVNLFTMLDQSAFNKQGRTAYELALRNEEKLQQLAGVIENQHSEYFNHIIKRSYAVLERADAMPAFDETFLGEVKADAVKVEYVSPLAQAQKMSGIQSIESVLGFIGQISSLEPNVMSMANFADMVRLYADKVGLETCLLKSKEEYEEIVTAKENEAESEKQMQMMMSAAKPMNEATGAMANMEKMDTGAIGDALSGMMAGGDV